MLRLARAWLAVLLLAATAHGAGIPAGTGEITLDIGDLSLSAYTYKPPGYAGGDLLVVLHGLGRNASGYRDYARALADRYGFVVVAPLLDRERFPTWRYQAGGLARRTQTGALQVEPQSAWLGATLETIVQVVRDIERAPHLPYAFVGHSAGAQALTRHAAFTATAARRIVIANPSTYLWPSREIAFPYGGGGLPDTISNDGQLQRYLELPIVVLLGTEDVKRDPDLNVSPGAMMQGPHRYARGLAYFRAGERLAVERGWKFGWRLLEVPGVGHSARGMLASEPAVAALAP